MNRSADAHTKPGRKMLKILHITLKKLVSDRVLPIKERNNFISSKEGLGLLQRNTSN